MQCQFESLRDRNVIVKCFNEACYHVSSAEPELQNYCPIHIQKLPRKTKLELLVDVIELPPSEILPTFVSPATVNETDSFSVSLLAGSVTSTNDFICDTNVSSSTIELHSIRKPKAGELGNLTIRPFTNLGHLCEVYGYLPRPKTWRMLPLVVAGQINGLPKSAGLAVATNGIHVAIENTACSALYIGHLEWFVIDDLKAPPNAKEILQNSATDILKVARNQLKEFEELF